ALLEMAKMRLASIYQTDHEEPIYLEYTLLDASGEALAPDTLQQPSSDIVDEPIDYGLAVGIDEERRESVVVPAGTYAWNEDEQEP
ncbi:MAG: hypothetical protein WCB63_12965, partial [Polyangiales bacterium]